MQGFGLSTSLGINIDLDYYGCTSYLLNTSNGFEYQIIQRHLPQWLASVDSLHELVSGPVPPRIAMSSIYG